MLNERYVVTAWHGESGSTFYVVDREAARGEWALAVFSTQTYGIGARTLAEAKVADLRKGGN